MFIIARRRGQRIAIGEDIEVTVTDISRNTVKIGISAPKACTIMRSELRESVEQANREALGTTLLTAQDVVGACSSSSAPLETSVATANAFLKQHVKKLARSDVTAATADSEASKLGET
jgi:carbon storage regulator